MLVDIVGLDSLLTGAGAINYEHKHDVIDYLARTPNAPVKSIADILATGLESGQLVLSLVAAGMVLWRRGSRRDSGWWRGLTTGFGRCDAMPRILSMLSSYPSCRRFFESIPADLFIGLHACYILSRRSRHSLPLNGR